MPMRFVVGLGCVLAMAGGMFVASAAEGPGDKPGSTPPSLPAAVPTGTGGSLLQLAPAAADALKSSSAPLRLDNVPLGATMASLSLERFEVLAPGAQFVVARPGGWERIAAPQITFWRGTVDGEPGSSVFIAAADALTIGSVDLGAGGDRFSLTSTPERGKALPAGQLAVFKATDSAPERPSVAAPGALCGVASPEPGFKADDPSGAVPDGKGNDGEADGPNIQRRLRVQLAVDTDFEYYTRFNDASAAATYIAMLYGQVSAVYLREIAVGVELSFVRIWDTPTDPYDVDGNDLLGVFRQTWQSTMGGVTRDLAQLCSGRCDLPYGGIAYVNGVCNSSSYSVVGYILGRYPDPAFPNAEGYDIMVTAHEIGHNFGTLHTHDYGLDHCDQITTPARRGTIMSYCSQTVSGGNAVTDLRFETSLRSIMRTYLNQRPCVDHDCNGNGVPDAQDIQNLTSLDANHNNIPDECEDCNGNGVLDPTDIAQGHSFDRNSNGIPDECEPDCNGNSQPDDMDISLGVSQDLNKDGVPDECQADCDGNGQADYNQIQSNMTLDIDRNRVLDSCQDCDNNGVNDLLALNGSRNLWVTSTEQPLVYEFYATTGVRFRTGSTPGMVAGQDVLVTPDRRVLVSSGEDDRIVEFDRTGAFVRTLVTGAPLDFPAGLALTDAGTLLVVSRNTSSVLEYDLSNGALIRTFIAPGSGGLTEPFAITITHGGGGTPQVLVSGDDSSVRRYDAATGAYLGIAIAPGAGGLDTPRGLLVKPDGRLLVTSLMNNRVIEYNLATGVVISPIWNHNGTDSVLRLLGPWGIRLGLDGNVYVAVNGNQGPQEFEPPPFFHDPLLHVTNTKVFRFDVRNGNYLTSYVTGEDTGLEHPAGISFMPLDEDLDCNANQFPDSCEIAQGLEHDCNANGRPDSCDIASGLATDYNHNGVPDSCECLADWNHDGVVNSTDVSDFINDWFSDQQSGGLATDFNHDGVSNSTDVSDFINAYFAGQGKC